MIRLALTAPLAAALCLGLAACKEEAASARPEPVEITAESIGHYCQMYVADHAGPKAQIHLKGYDAPLFFGQVSDAIAYLHDPERPAEIAAIYVSDMGTADSWAIPGPGHWTDAETARFVIESDRMGGMGMPEAVPFAKQEDAEAFVAEAGGRIVGLHEVPEAYVRPDMSDFTDKAGTAAMSHGMDHGGDHAGDNDSKELMQ